MFDILVRDSHFMKLLIFRSIKIMRLLSCHGGQKIFITAARSAAPLLLTEKKQLIFMLQTKTFINLIYQGIRKQLEMFENVKEVLLWRCKKWCQPCRCMWVLRLYWLLYVLLHTGQTACTGTQAWLWYRDMCTLSECSFFISRWQCWQERRSSHSNPATDRATVRCRPCNLS